MQTNQLDFLKITGNTFNTKNDGSLWTDGLMSSFRIKRGAHVEICNNNALLTQQSFKMLKNLEEARHLALRGNPIEMGTKLPNKLFYNFTNLKYLDLGKHF